MILKLFVPKSHIRVNFLNQTYQNRQFDWIEKSLVYDESDKHAINYDSYHLEQEIVLIQNVSIENISNTYCDSNELKYDINDVTEKHRLYK